MSVVGLSNPIEEIEFLSFDSVRAVDRTQSLVGVCDVKIDLGQGKRFFPLS